MRIFSVGGEEVALNLPTATVLYKAVNPITQPSGIRMIPLEPVILGKLSTTCESDAITVTVCNA
jgi:hypothetical protein